MLPYVERQLLYALASGATTLAAWLALGRSARLRASPRARMAACAAVLAAPTLLWIALARALDDWHSTYQFLGIAHGFYVGLFWLPCAALFAAELRRRRGGERDLPLAAACLGLVALGFHAAFVEPNRLQVERQRLALPDWPSDAPPLRVVHVSDLQTVGPCARNDRAAEAIDALEPDLIVVTGDYAAGPFGGEEPEPAVAEARRFLERLRPSIALVCVAGHSEREPHRRQIFAGLDVLYLNDEERIFELGAGRRLRVFGLRADGGDLAAYSAESEPGLATLFVSHVPDVSPDLEGLGVDLHLAGHTHGGQVALPWFGAPLTLSALPRRYARGLHRFGDHWLNVSAGIGMEGNHAPRFRILCPPEIDLIELAGSGSPTGSQPGS
jgi:predicted MPP superfamily phosphohydrolase